MEHACSKMGPLHAFEFERVSCVTCVLVGPKMGLMDLRHALQSDTGYPTYGDRDPHARK